MVTVADTAYSIARVRADERELFDDPYARLFQPSGEALEATERYLSLPFFRDGIRLRTRFIDDFVREGLREGLAHLVILGSGFDTRAQRMPELANATVYEVDYEEQLAKKRALVPAGHVIDLACDFNAPNFERGLEEQLRGPAMFIWEGVIGYIAVDVIDRTLAMMARVGGRAVFNFGPAIFDPASASDHVRRAGFAQFEELGFDELWRRYLPGEPHAAAAYARMGVARA
jgi:methyltransferase (TIGR00027 family)